MILQLKLVVKLKLNVNTPLTLTAETLKLLRELVGSCRYFSENLRQLYQLYLQSQRLFEAFKDTREQEISFNRISHKNLT